MFTNLTPFGEPIQKGKFVQHYMELFEGAIKKCMLLIPSILKNANT
ncbi:Uncharacterised protein [Enterococcus faecium]|nr:Uncharacterised protein [Enterococcus faecium]SMJ87729.1 Uncharacterised protein [Enterococcus faecium]SMK30561.1 Uncharacterised protein [Enterococcus faecium]SMK32496.1 Uncharacterised protein [Enterococcus faecium]SMK39862.1 Uncharacterised protein [Enterococcus faecium]